MLFGEAISKDEFSERALYSGGVTKTKLGAWADAIKDFSTLIELNDECTLAHVARGGCYERLKRFREAREDYVRAGLPQGVISHDTALQVHNLGTWRDSKVHLTVPNRFRRSAMPTQVHLHYENLNPDDVMTKHHFKITKPLKTIVDLLIVGYVSDDYLLEALEEAIDSRQILQADVMSLCSSDYL